MNTEYMRLNEALEKPMDYDNLMQCVQILSNRFRFLSVGYLGQSILGSPIPLLSIGEGDRGILYVGCHHGMEWITTTVLLRFLNDICVQAESKSCAYRYSLPYLLETRTLYFIPMLNPDGVSYQIHGPNEDHPLYDRLVKMNHGNKDFSTWQANARGVDLNHNYNFGFAAYKELEATAGIEEGAPTRYSGTMPESEPETGMLCNFIRFHKEIGMALTLHTQGEVIYDGSGEYRHPKSQNIAKAFVRMSGYAYETPSDMASYGGLTDWMVGELGRLCFTLECGKGSNPLPIRDSLEIYMGIRELLFSAPIYL